MQEDPELDPVPHAMNLASSDVQVEKGIWNH